MDILDEVAKLVSEIEAKEKQKQVDHEATKGILLHEATADYLESVRRHKWKRAHDQLVQIFQFVTAILSTPQADDPGDDQTSGSPPSR